MLEKIGNSELIIAPLYIKEEILKEITRQKSIINYKFMTIEKFKKDYFTPYDERALYFLMKKYDLKYSVSKEYLDNIFINNTVVNRYRKDLENEKLLHYKNIDYKNICIIGYENIEPYIKKILDNYNTKYIKEEIKSKNNPVYEFENEEKEIVYVTEKIINDLKIVNINDMYLVIPNEEYEIELKRIFKLYGIPLDIDENQGIYSTKTAQTFYKCLIQTKNIQKSLETIEKNEIYNQIVNILNKYTFIKEIDDKFIEIIKNELKKTKIKTKKIENAVKVIKIDQIYDKRKYYYMLGFNQNLIPKIYEENGIITDKEKEKNNLYTSLKKNILEKEKVKKIINFPNIYISYKLKDNYNSFYPSSLIEDLELEVKREKPKLNHSNKYNKLLLTALLDDYLNYNEKDEIIYYLFPTYKDINYKTYDNQYEEIDSETFKDHIKSELTISYSSMNNYFLCPFKFYIENILKLNKKEDTISIIIGNLFHSALQNIYDENFDLDKHFTHYLNNTQLTSKDLFFIEKLKNILKEDIKVIKMQDSISSFNKKETEKKIVIKKENNIKIVGIIDKISSLDNYVIITDYKTGSIQISLDNITDGLNMQLPMYIYLIKKGLNRENKIVGFYLQKLINKSTSEEENINNLKLNGYTINDEKIIEKIDSTYKDSKMIKGMKKTKKDFYTYTKLITKEQIDIIEKITEENINKVISGIKNRDFKINPKRLNNELISCKYCKYKDLCFYKEENIKTLKLKSFKDIVGDNDA